MQYVHFARVWKSHQGKKSWKGFPPAGTWNVPHPLGIQWFRLPVGKGGSGMHRSCSNRPGKRNNRRARPLGIVLMFAGIILLMVCVPYWLWTSILGILLISVGFLLWRFN